MSNEVWHVELATTDRHAAAKWYSELFGWEIQNFEEMNYIQAVSGENAPTVAFVPVNAEQGMPAGAALIYVDSPDVDAAGAKARELGGTLLMEKQEIPTVGWLTIVADPHGNRIAIMQRMSTDPLNSPRAAMLRQQINNAVQNLTGTMEGVTSEIAHQQPGGRANSIAANAAHVVTAVDGIVHGMIQGEVPLAMSLPTGLSEPPPRGENTFNWHEWGQSLTLDLETFHQYARKVFESVDDFLATMDDSLLDKKLDTPAGERSVFQMLNGAVLTNLIMHTGEISALKGTQGLKGYPF